MPHRRGVEIGVETVRRLAAATPRVVGIKEAVSNPDRISQLRAALGARFSIFSGEDSMTVAFMALGAHGVISVASNIIPGPVAQMVRACARGDFAAALKLHDHYHPVFKTCSSRQIPCRSKRPPPCWGKSTGNAASRWCR